MEKFLPSTEIAVLLLTVLLVAPVSAQQGQPVATPPPSHSILDRRGVYSVAMFGAKGDSKTDDTAAIQKALEFLHPNAMPYLSHGDIKASHALLRGQGRTTFIGCHFYYPEGPFVPKNFKDNDHGHGVGIQRPNEVVPPKNG